jgi:hypothetical protein
MALTIYLAQVIGLYLIIGGAAIMLRRTYFMPVVGAFVEERMLRMVIGVIELIAGLCLVVAHTVWSPLPAAIVSLVGWIMTLEGAFYLLASDAIVSRLINKFNTRAWYVWGGVFSIVVGLYLVGFGFTWL